MSTQAKKEKALGVNHVVLEVNDLDEALEFCGAIMDFELRGRSDTQAFVDMGDQFLQFSLGKKQSADDKRHFGLVVDQRETIRAKLEEIGVELLKRGLNFRDPWGNRAEIVPY
jgi:lactoylglutathione lyase